MLSDYYNFSYDMSRCSNLNCPERYRCARGYFYDNDTDFIHSIVVSNFQCSSASDTNFIDLSLYKK